MLRFLLVVFALIAVVAAVVAPNVLHLANPHRLYDGVVPVKTDQVKVPEIRELPDFSQYSQAADKKQAFFGFLAPVVAAENALIEQQRQGLQALHTKWLFKANSLNREQRSWLEYLAKRYRVDFDLQEGAAEMFELLLRRVDVVPETLVLVQAANESAWGTSRFATEAFNLFGEWCFSEGCGIVPNLRGDEARHEVERFSTINASVRSYLMNLNTHPAYVELRTLRAAKRAENADIRALDLTPGLLSYSERGEAYIEELNAMIRVNRPLILEALDETGPLPEPGFNASAATNSNSAPE